MTLVRNWFRRQSLRSLLVAFLVVYGVLPLSLGALLSVRQNGELLDTQQRVNLAYWVESLSEDFAAELDSAGQRLDQLGAGLALIPTVGLAAATQVAWRDGYLKDFLIRNPDLLDVRVMFVAEQREFAATQVEPEISVLTREAMQEAVLEAAAANRFVLLPGEESPAAIVTRVVTDPDSGAVVLALGALIELPFRSAGEATVVLVDSTGDVLWAEDASEASLRGLRASRLLEDFVNHPTVFVAEYTAETGRSSQAMIAQVSPVGESGWGIVVQQPKEVAFGAARRVGQATLLASLLMVVLALIFAVGASQFVSAPIRRMAAASRELAAGNLGVQAPSASLGRELGDLADSFNAMSGQLESYVDRLQKAAEQNHQLFLGSVRALLAAVEAKEPYTRGHSERVAGYSRILGQQLGLSKEELDKLWVSGLLHDVGKIGIEDRILNKGDTLTVVEFDRMKDHTTIGAEIMSSIDHLSYSIPVVRSHHERVNGQGYPDGLRGEAIPFTARIVAVADSFDAMTTQRVYQDPMSALQAADRIRSEAGQGFDADVVDAFSSAFDGGLINAAATAPLDEEMATPVTAGLYT